MLGANISELLIHNLKSHTPLQRGDPVLKLLKPAVNCRMDKSLILNMWKRFLEKLIMLNNGFVLLETDYLETVEFEFENISL